MQAEFADLRDTINNSVTDLMQMVGEILQNSGSIASAASQSACAT